MKMFVSLAIIAGLCLMPQVHADKTGKANEDSCTIPLSVFVPSWKKAIEKETPADSKIRKAALEVLSGKLQKGTVNVACQGGEVKKGLIQGAKVEPAKGEVVLDGITWEWEITALVAGGQIFVDANPVWARFRLDARFTIKVRSNAPVMELPLIQVVWDEETRRFYVVAGAGKEQDATKVHKDAKADK